MDVGVNQPGKHRGIREVGDAHICGHGRGIPPHRDDASLIEQDDHASSHEALTVKRALRPNRQHAWPPLQPGRDPAPRPPTNDSDQNCTLRPHGPLSRTGRAGPLCCCHAAGLCTDLCTAARNLHSQCRYRRAPSRVALRPESTSRALLVDPGLRAARGRRGCRDRVPSRAEPPWWIAGGYAIGLAAGRSARGQEPGRGVAGPGAPAARRRRRGPSWAWQVSPFQLGVRGVGGGGVPVPAAAAARPPGPTPGR